MAGSIYIMDVRGCMCACKCVYTFVCVWVRVWASICVFNCIMMINVCLVSINLHVKLN
jgi:hypothetical protein